MEREIVDETETFQDPLPPSEESMITTGRIVNVVIAVACLSAMIACIVCLAVMAHKHSELIRDIDPSNKNSHSDKEICILYATTTFNDSSKRTVPQWNKSHACQFVIFGSSFVAGVLLLVIFYYIMRLFIMRSINALIIFELVGFGLLAVMMFAIAVVVSAGRAYTCDRLTHNIPEFSKCSDAHVNHKGTNVDPVYIYSALKASEVSAWISFLLLLALVIVSIVKLIIWLMRNSARRRDERQLDSFIAPENDDDEPLPM